MNEFFLSILNMSITASYVIIVVILVRLPLKKAPRIISYALWSVVAFRLLCPFSFESIFSLLPRAITPIPQNIVYQQTPQVNSRIDYVDTFANEKLPMATVEGSEKPLHIYIQIGSYIWILGMMIMLIYSIISVILLKRKLKATKWIEENIYEANNLKTPFVLGSIRPKIYLPAGLSAEEQHYILLHEQTHIHRWDHIIKPFAFCVLSIHWFNPLVWISFMLMSTDMELSCDEKVMKEVDENIKKSYATSLLSLAAGKRILNGSPLAFGEGNVKGRIKNVLHFKKPTFWIITVAVIMVASVYVGLITNPQTISLPEADVIQSIEMEQFNEYSSLGSVTIDDIRSIDAVLSNLSDAKKTMRQSTNDYPAQNNYLMVRLMLEGEGRTLCLYSDGGSYYIEEPYAGVYKSDRAASIAMYEIYTGSDLKNNLSFSETYASDQCLYMNPLSSYSSFSGSGYLYLVEEDSFSIIDEKTGEVNEAISHINWNGKNFSDDEWKAMFDFSISMPDISGIDYYSRTMVMLSDKYRLLKMDDEIWLAQMNRDKIWSLYRLKSFRGITTGDVEGLEPINPDTLPVTTDLEQSISNAILNYYSGMLWYTLQDYSDMLWYTWSEVAGEGHITLETEEKDGLTYAYIWERYCTFGFENGILTGIGGHANPATIVFQKDSDKNYVLKEFIRPLDGSGYGPSIKEMFSTSASEKLASADSEENRKMMDAQAEAYAREYLVRIGRKADIQINLRDKIKVDMNTDVSNYLGGAYGEYPYWIGTREVVENGIRYLYEKSWQGMGGQDGIVTFLKSIYEGEVIEKTVIEVKGSEMNCIEGTLREEHQIPTYLFVNKMDLDGTDGKVLMEELKKRLHDGCVDFGEEQVCKTQWMENLAMCHEEMFEKYMEHLFVETEDVATLIAQRKVFPCYFGSALKLEGVEAFLSGLKQFTKSISYPEKFGAKVYKIARDDQGNRLTYMKITGGSLKVKMLLTNQKEKVDQIRIYSGIRYEAVDEAFAGMVCAVTGLSKTYPGEGLGMIVLQPKRLCNLS